MNYGLGENGKCVIFIYSLFQYPYNQNLKRKKESWQVSKGLRKCSSLYIVEKRLL